MEVFVEYILQYEQADLRCESVPLRTGSHSVILTCSLHFHVDLGGAISSRSLVCSSLKTRARLCMYDIGSSLANPTLPNYKFE